MPRLKRYRITHFRLLPGNKLEILCEVTTGGRTFHRLGKGHNEVSTEGATPLEEPFYLETGKTLTLSPPGNRIILVDSSTGKLLSYVQGIPQQEKPKQASQPGAGERGVRTEFEVETGVREDAQPAGATSGGSGQVAEVRGHGLDRISRSAPGGPGAEGQGEPVGSEGLAEDSEEGPRHPRTARGL